jgi:subtilase family serine protease
MCCTLRATGSTTRCPTPTERTRHAPSHPPTPDTSSHVPRSVASEVMAVSGLTTAKTQQPAGTFSARQVSSPEGKKPSDIQSLYDLGPLYSQNINGSGQTIAIASFADYAQSNVETFDSQFNLPTNLTRISVSDGRTTGALLGSKNGQDEAEADIELVQSVAPGANILVYEAPTSDAGAIAIYNRIVSDNRASVVSNSWGGAEANTTPSVITAIHQTMPEAAAQGQAVFSSSGDNGAYDAASTGGSHSSDLAVDYPASDPWVTGVGGTTLQTNGGTYGNETAWSDNSSRTPTGSGGGLSTQFSKSSYQVGLGVSNGYSNGMRQVPDVAANADPATGYAIYAVSSRNGPG